MPRLRSRVRDSSPAPDFSGSRPSAVLSKSQNLYAACDAALHCTEAIELNPLPPSSQSFLENKRYQSCSFRLDILKASFCVALCLCSGKAAQAEWVEIASNATVNRTLYVDYASKKKNRKFVTIWAMYDDVKPRLINNKPSLSSIHEYQVDCNIASHQSMRRTFYEGPKGTGEQVGSSIDTSWVPVNPTTVAEAIYKVTLAQALIAAACAKD